ncbi:MAG: DNA gyrase inhibitor YacG [Rhizobiales bacterium]|nr:DNA gyrase inhibitor YacG [Hyphomicrobiales bacterium]
MTEPDRFKPCPICGKPADAKLTPFCSPRCADVDLNRWLVGVYAIPVEEDEDAGDAEAAAEQLRDRKA